MAVPRLKGVVRGERGKVLTLTLKHPTTGAVQNISSYDGTITTRVRSPEGNKVVTATCAFVTDGSDGKIKFSFSAGQIDRHGDWDGTINLGLASDSELGKSYPFVMVVEKAV